VAERAPALLQQLQHVQTTSGIAKLPVLTKVPVSTDSANLEYVDVGSESMKLWRVSGNSGELRYGEVFKGVDMLVKPLDTYTPGDAKKNGLEKGYGVINLKGGTQTTFKFQFLKHDTEVPVTISKLYFTMANIDLNSGTKDEVSMLTAFDQIYLDPQSSVHWTFRNGTSPAVFLATAAEPLTFGTKEHRRDTVTWKFLSVSELTMTLATPGGKDYESRNFHFSGKSSLTKDTCLKRSEANNDLDLSTLEYSNLGGYGPTIGSPKAMRFKNVANVDGHSVDMIIKNTAGRYAPGDQANNGIIDGLASMNVQPGTDANFTFSFVKTGGNEAVTLDTVHITFLDLDRAPESNGQTVEIESHGMRRAFLSTSSKYEMRELGQGHYNFVSKISDPDKFSRRTLPECPMRLTEEQQSRSVSFEFQEASILHFSIKMGKARRGEVIFPRNLYITGSSRLTAGRETPFICS